jgi:hypothetical protein
MTQEEIEQSSQEVRALYQPYLTGPASRIARGGELMQQFEAAVQICHADPRSDERSLTERVNEMAVAKQLADDPHLLGLITYEPNFLPDGRRIDFVAERPDDNLYVEVKTVHPRTDDSEAAWQRYVRLRAHQPANVHVVLDREWMGAALYGFKFASRSHFLDYTLSFETRLAAAKAQKQGPGILVFCGNGFAWHRSDLEDFADFYHFGRHRQDDAFALMEQHDIEARGREVRRNVDHFAYLKRAVERAEITEFRCPVRGPVLGR